MILGYGVLVAQGYGSWITVVELAVVFWPCGALCALVLHPKTNHSRALLGLGYGVLLWVADYGILYAACSGFFKF